MRKVDFVRRTAGVLLLISLIVAMFLAPYSLVYEDIGTLTVTYQELDELNTYGLGKGSVRAVSSNVGNDIFKDIVFKKGGFPFRRVKAKVVDEQKVFVGGVPIGFAISTDGIIVVGVTSVMTENGKISPCQNADIRAGDIIVELGGERVVTASDLNRIAVKPQNAGKELSVVFKRKDKRMETKITPALDCITKTFKLGLWVRDSAAGIGTMTYVKQENKHFGALGHPICDSDTNTQIPVNSGKIYSCSLLGITKGQKGKPGELKGMFVRASKPIGSIALNNKFGVFGKADTVLENPLFTAPIAVANRASVKPGKAQLVTTVEDTPRIYDIEIVKASYQKSKDHKSMVVRVTDKDLLLKTGGIVQGMSGSPILQNGRIVGALTHVFVNDPTKGYGVYLDWMYNEF